MGRTFFPHPGYLGAMGGVSSVALRSSRLGQLHPNNRVNYSVLPGWEEEVAFLCPAVGELSIYFLKKFNDREHSNGVFPHIVSLKKILLILSKEYFEAVPEFFPFVFETDFLE